MKTNPLQSSKLKWQLLALAGIISVLLIILGYVYYRYEERIIRDDKYSELNVIAELKINQILQWRNERLVDANVITQSTIFKNAVKLILAEKNTLAIRQDILNQLSIIKAQYGYDEVFIVSPEGEVVLSNDPSIKYPCSISINTIRKALEQKAVVFTDFYFCNKQILIDVIAPITDNINKPIAALIFQINPSIYIYPLIQTWPTNSKTAETLLIRKDGDSVIYVNELRHAANTALKLRIPLTSINVPAVQTVLGRVGIWEGKDYRGIQVLSDIRPVPGTPWFMVAKVDKSEIYAELYYRAFVSFILVTLLIFLFGATLSWIYHSRQNKTYMELLLAEKKLDLKEDEFRTALYSIGDGIITTDLKGCVRQMNNVAEQLTGWTEINAIGKKLDEVFKIINEETRKPVENPVDKVLHEGLIVGLANHTLLLSVEGKETPIADSGAPIRSDTGEIGGVVLVFRDQSAERIAELRLRESEEKFRNVFENSVVGKSMTTLDGKLRVNKAFSQILGYSEDELINLKWQKITHPDDIENDTKIINSIISFEKTNARWEKRYIHKNGNIVWVDISTYLMRDSNKNPLYFITTINDITDRKLAEIALRDEKDRIRTILDLVGDPIFVKDNDHRITLANRAFYDIFKLDESNVIGFTLVEAVPENERHHFLKIDRSVLDTGIPDLREEELTVEGSKQYIITRKIRFIDESGGRFLVGSIHDITERKLAEENLFKHSERLRNLHLIDQAILQAIESPESVVQTAIQHIRELLNSQRVSVGIFDLEKKEVLVYAADIDGKTIVQVDKVLTEEVYGVIISLRQNKMEIVEDMSMEASPSFVNLIFQAEGIQSYINIALVSELEMYGVLNVGWEKSKNITLEEIEVAGEVAIQITIAIEKARLLKETKGHASELEERVRVRTNQLQVANKELETFTYSVSHDLKAPLRGIDGYSKLLLDLHGKGLNEEARTFLATIRSSTLQMNQLIDDLLEYSRLERSQMSHEKIKIKNLISSITSSYKNELDIGGYLLKIEVPDIELMSNTKGLTIALRNLVENAIKFTRGKPSPTIEIGLKELAYSWKFWVKDNGTGFDMKYHQRIFEIFQRLHRAEDFPGTGIGLAMVNKAMQRMNGRVWAESEPETGSAFYLEIPKTN